jgi:uncharacterized protein (DUF302 family)
VNRRRLLGLLAAGGASTAGCLGDDAGDDGANTTANEADTMHGETTSKQGIETVERDGDFETVADGIRSDIEAGDFSLVTVVDHAENAASVDEELPPTRLFVFGNPKAGTPLIADQRSVALDLPQKLLVWEAEGQTSVAYNDPEYLAERHGLGGHDDRLQGMSEALRGLATGE